MLQAEKVKELSAMKHFLKETKNRNTTEVKRMLRQLLVKHLMVVWYNYQSYSCFFCWGGADSGCKATVG
jgi:hypothetical protein